MGAHIPNSLPGPSHRVIPMAYQQSSNELYTTAATFSNIQWG